MPNQLETSEILLRYIKARVPFIAVRSIERGRAMDVLNHAASQMRSMAFFTHSRTTGLHELGSQTPISDDRSLVGALDYATSMLTSRNHSNFVFMDVEDLETESSSSRHFAEMARLAEARQGSIIVVVSSPIWPGLARLGMTVTLDLPDVDELADVITDLADDHRSMMPIEWGPDEIRRASEILLGVTQTEAVNAITTLLAKGSVRHEDIVELSKFKEQVFGDLNGIESVTLKPGDYQVGGLTNLRMWLGRKKELIRADLSSTPLHPPKGVLLVGVPGCGKSLSAKAIASEWQLPLYRLDMGAILGMYVGQSEGQLREALDAAERVSPCVLWVDEIEKGFASGDGDSGITRRLVGQFLYWLQENTSKVFLVATANDVTSLPPEMLRKGRFDEIFFVDLPTDDERREIIELYSLKYLASCPEATLLENLVELTRGFSGSDIEAAMHDIATDNFLAGAVGMPSADYVERVFANVMPFSRTNPEEVAAIRSWGSERAVPAGADTLPADLVTSQPSARRVVMTGV